MSYFLISGTIARGSLPRGYLSKRIWRRLVAIPWAAPLVYRTALSAYLETRYPNQPPVNLSDGIGYYINRSDYSEALEKLIDGND
jgi:hypothetical protein